MREVLGFKAPHPRTLEITERSFTPNPDDDPLLVDADQRRNPGDGNLWTSTVGDGFSVRLLLARVWECRLDLGEDEEAWIGGLVEAGASSIRRRDGGRLLGLARRLGLVADDEDE